ncbi:MAG: hypothetical protein QW614_00865 [Candidatus Caldarchaeum sp.]|uniref:Uncharacterized protein n=1 Tax=Caldiarchaeum subterraneum TaxID=311458 RepID=A0A7C5L7E7_CALS0
MAEEKKEEELPLDFLETPKGRVAGFEGVRRLGELIAEAFEELEKLNQKIKSMEREEKTPEGIEKRLKGIEDQLAVLSDDMHVILNALGELSATVAQLKKALNL